MPPNPHNAKTTCPECHAPLVETEDEVNCPNPTCEWDNDAPGVPANEYNTTE